MSFEAQRTLELVDIRTNSITSGCVYAPYWRGDADPLISDGGFVNARWQEAAYLWALLYNDHRQDNFRSNNSRLLEAVEKATAYWCSIQHKDGSFNEWRRNEHGQPPTAFGLYAFCGVYREVGDCLPLTLRNRLLSSLGKAACFLTTTDHWSAVNHEAVAVAALYAWYEISGWRSLLRTISRKVEKIRECQSSEGWLWEVGGPDVGYNTVSLSYLADYMRKSGDNAAEQICRDVVGFNKYFTYPDGVAGGGMNSRYAIQLLPLGYGIMAESCGTASALFRYGLRALVDKTIEQYTANDYSRCVGLYILYLSLDCTNLQIPVSLPCEKPDLFTKSFPEAQVVVHKTRQYYGVFGPGGSLSALYHFGGHRTVIYTSPFGGQLTSGWQGVKANGRLSGTTRGRLSHGHHNYQWVSPARPDIVDVKHGKLKRLFFSVGNYVPSLIVLLRKLLSHRLRPVWSPENFRPFVRRTILFFDNGFTVESELLERPEGLMENYWQEVVINSVGAGNSFLRLDKEERSSTDSNGRYAIHIFDGEKRLFNFSIPSEVETDCISETAGSMQNHPLKFVSASWTTLRFRSYSNITSYTIYMAE